MVSEEHVAQTGGGALHTDSLQWELPPQLAQREELGLVSFNLKFWSESQVHLGR